MQDSLRTRLVLGVLLATAIGLITLDHAGFGPVARLRSAASAVLGPVERLASAVARPVVGSVEAAARAQAAQHKITLLEREDQRLRAELSQAQLDRVAAAELGQLLQLAGRGGYRVVAARVVGIGPGYEDTVTIDAGTRDGVRPEQTVLDGDGLVGRIVEAGPYSAVVLLITDAASQVGCRLAGSGEMGVIRGTGKSLSSPGMLQMELFSANVVPQAGQRIVTLGSVGGHPYVPGVPIGTVVSAAAAPGGLTSVALVRPFARMTALDVVGVVIVPPRTDPRDSVLPPAPAPSASPPVSGGGGASPAWAVPGRLPTLPGA